MNVEYIAWLAGLLEGEGCFTSSQRLVGRPVLILVLCSTDEDVVRRAAVILRAQHRVRRVPRRAAAAAHHKDEWDLRLYGADAEQGMRMVLPYMGKRRSARINELLSVGGYSHQ